MVTDSVANFQADRFSDRLRVRARQTHSWLCIGLDPQSDRLPAAVPRTGKGIQDFCAEIVEATIDLAVCYKINFAFFEALGGAGWQALERVRSGVPDAVPVIADAKRGDIPSTMRYYARAIFDELRFDAVTVSPYLGWDALQPFLDDSSRAVLVLARTSNDGAGDYQDLELDGEPLYLRVARDVVVHGGRHPSTNAFPPLTGAEIGVVAGANDIRSLEAIRALDERLLILVPGVGEQGGSARVVMRTASNFEGENALINVSRSVIHASVGADFADAARESALRILAEMRED
jgi:orotidine-5'-phosphate decarboxylase